MTGTFGYGQFTPWDGADEHAVMAFIVSQILGRISTMKLVRVEKFTANANPDLPGRVNVKPLVKQVDGNNNATPHGTVFDLIYFRLQAGGNAVVINPKVGDVGLCVVADRDSSAVKSSGGEESTPGSSREFSLADGVYIGAVLGGAPTQKIEFTDAGITISDSNGNSMVFSSSGVNVTTAAFRCNGSVIAGFGTGDQVGLQSHTHLVGVTPTSPPTPGT